MSDALQPLKYPQGDLFVCDITDVIIKDDLASMEHPFYSLSKKPDREPRRYESNGMWIEFRPSVKGLPTIYDKDLIIYAISQLVAGKLAGRPPAKTVEINPYDFFVFTNRGTGGRDYDALCDSLDRLDGTRFRTNVLFDGTMTDTWMGIIDQAQLETDTKTGKPRRLRITLSDMVLEAVQKTKILTLHRDYFRLKRPIERRVYELARKHCGQQDRWRCRLETLRKKSGSRASLREFRRLIKNLVKNNPLPDYTVTIDDEDMLTFINRGTVGKNDHPPLPTIYLDAEVYADAVEVSGGWDKYMLEREWHAFCAKHGIVPRNPEAHFLDFCRKWRERRGNA